MTRKKSDDAVSPVIGVMLMLVVTVVIAGVISIFATGMVADTEPAPVAKLDVEIISDQSIRGMASKASSDSNSGTVPTLHITHVSGDSLNTENLKLSFSWDCNNPDCDVKHHTSTYQAGELSGEKATKFADVTFAAMNPGGTTEALYINHGSKGLTYFGEHVLKRGETMVAYDLHLMVPTEGAEQAGNPAMDVLFNNGVVITEYDATRTETQTVTNPGNPVNGHFVTNGEIHDAGSSCRSVQGVVMPTRYFNAYQVALFCTACADWTTQTGNAYAPCPFCGEKTETLKLRETTCPKCGEDFSKVKAPSTYQYDVEIQGTGYSAGIMECLSEGTAVEVMITHIPSSKVIYEDRVFVE